MAATDVNPNRLDAAKQAAKRFVDSLPQGLQVGLLSFDENASMVVSPTSDRDAVVAGISSLQLGPGTATGPAISLALQAISAAAARRRRHTGAGRHRADERRHADHRAPATCRPKRPSPQATTAAKAASVPVNTIAFGTPNGTVTVQGQQHPVPADPQAMAKIAQDTGGQTFDAQTADQLTQTYSKIATTIGYDTELHEITVWFTAFGLVAAGAGRRRRPRSGPNA